MTVRLWGIDIGSRFTKLSILEFSRKVDPEKIVQELKNHIKFGEDNFLQLTTTFLNSIDVIANLKSFLKENSITPDNAVFTGYGREVAKSYGFKILNEVKAVSKTVQLFESECFIDIGGQDIKAGCISTYEYNLNSSCAAGTGSFIENILRRLNISWEEFFKIEDPTTEVKLNSVCAVFAESEAINLLVKGIEKLDIVKAAINSVAQRAAMLLPKKCTLDQKLPKSSPKNCTIRPIIKILKPLNEPEKKPILPNKKKLDPAEKQPDYFKINSTSNSILLLGRLSKSRALQKAIENKIGRSIYTPPLSSFFASIGCLIEAVETLTFRP